MLIKSMDGWMEGWIILGTDTLHKYVCMYVGRTSERRRDMYWVGMNIWEELNGRLS